MPIDPQYLKDEEEKMKRDNTQFNLFDFFSGSKFVNRILFFRLMFPKVDDRCLSNKNGIEILSFSYMCDQLKQLHFSKFHPVMLVVFVSNWN